LGHQLLALPAASAPLLGSALAPTHPVLALEVEAGPPKSGEEDFVAGLALRAAEREKPIISVC
jgi:hypothetical protein